MHGVVEISTLFLQQSKASGANINTHKVAELAALVIELTSPALVNRQ